MRSNSGCKCRRRKRLRRSDPVPGQEILSDRLAGAGIDGVAGLVHVRDGGQRDGFQHGLDLRYLPGLLRSTKRPIEHYMWMGRFMTVVGILLSIGCAYFAGNVQQRDGYHPTGFWIRQRADVRDLSAGDVLGAEHRDGRVPWPFWRHWHVGAGAWFDRRRGQRRDGWARNCLHFHPPWRRIFGWPPAPSSSASR